MSNMLSKEMIPKFSFEIETKMFQIFDVIVLVVRLDYQTNAITAIKFKTLFKNKALLSIEQENIRINVSRV